MWWRAKGVVRLTGLMATLPIIVSTVRAVNHGWLPLGDDATIAIRSFDVLSLHPPVVGQYSVSSNLIGAPVRSPGPLLYWLLALPVRMGPAAPTIAMGIVNGLAVIGAVALAARRGGRLLMFASAAGLAAICASFDAPLLHDIWNPAAALLPFALLMFIVWSVACGEYRLLPLAALLASYVVQAHLVYVAPVGWMLAVAGGFLVATRPRVPRRWIAGTAAVVLVCWSLPLAEEVVDRPGNLERIVQAATAHGSRFGWADGWHAVVRTIGVPPWWLRSPPNPFERLGDVASAPGIVATASAVAGLAGLLGLAAIGLRSRRRQLAVPALLALGLTGAVATVTASTPNGAALFAVIGYTLWWASAAGMFCWLVLGYGAMVLCARGQRVARWRERVHTGRNWRASAVAGATGVATVAAIGAIVATKGRPHRVETIYRPARAVIDRVRKTVPPGRTVLLASPTADVPWNVRTGLAYGLRASGRPFVASLLGIGSEHDPHQHRHDTVVTVVEQGAKLPRGSDVVARVKVGRVPPDGPPTLQSRPRTVIVTVTPTSGDARPSAGQP
jgi:MYXO-CTERM domain-containing protein